MPTDSTITLELDVLAAVDGLLAEFGSGSELPASMEQLRRWLAITWLDGRGNGLKVGQAILDGRAN